eukprot:jgi/Ulvmu1/12840/UM098_0025.1
MRKTMPRSSIRASVRPGPVAATPRASTVMHIAAPERTTVLDESDALNVSLPQLEDPWEDPKWTKYKWTVYRGEAYDLTDFIERHPAGNWLINLSLGRDCTALFESYHLRPEVAVARLKKLPSIPDFPVAAVPVSPRPNDSELYNAIRDRVRKEVFKGREAKGAHRSGSEWAALAILGYASAAYTLYTTFPNLLTGALLGLGGAWIGLTVQHCGNHGAMSTNTLVNKAMGLCDDLIGGSSLMWRYHHQVSHHIHCNDEALDEDVFSAFPFLRFDTRLPRYSWHRFQHIYMWFTFPLLQLGFQISDMVSLASNRTPGASLYGATDFERKSVIAGKIAHWGLLWGIPMSMHGFAAVLPASMAYVFMEGIVLASTFAVSHNIPETKPLYKGAEAIAAPTDENLAEDYGTRDWGVQQVLTSANWGGVVGNFMTGGLNLQVEHHLFPAISFMHYPAIAKVVREECEARGINYASYDTLPEILSRFYKYMKEAGSAEQTPMKNGQLGDIDTLRDDPVGKM